MNEVLVNMFRYMISYLGIIVILFFIVNFQTKGYLGTFIRVKMSNGKLILGRIKSFTDTYYRAVKQEDGFLKIKLRSKEVKDFPITSEDLARYVNREMGVSVIECTEEFNKFRDFTLDADIFIQDYDSAGTECLLERFKNRPQVMSKNEKLIIMLLLVVAVVGIIYIAYKQGKVIELLTTLQSLSGNV